MSKSNMQQNHPYPQGRGVGSVPVLFSLRNVQPNIVSGIANANNNNTKTTNTIKSIEPDSAATVSPAVGITANSSRPGHPISKHNRPFNIVVGLLILALCLLVIRNSQGTKTSSKGEVASSDTLIKPTESKDAANSKPESVPPSISKAHEHNPLELGSSTVSTPAFATSHSTTSQSSSTLFRTQSEPIPESKSIEELKAVQKSKDNEQLLVQATTVIPSLLQNSKQETLDETFPTSGNASTGKIETAITQSQPGVSFPEPRRAMKQESPGLKGDTTIPLQSTTETPAQGIADTHAPLTTKEIISLYERGKQTSPTSNVPATTISYAAQTVVGNSSNVMTGQPYPAPSKEYVPLTIPANEQTQIDSRQGIAGPIQESEIIRQPAVNNGNRYQYIAQPTQIPYTPIAAPQVRNSVGYPPGN